MEWAVIIVVAVAISVVAFVLITKMSRANAYKKASIMKKQAYLKKLHTRVLPPSYVVLHYADFVVGGVEMEYRVNGQTYDQLRENTSGLLTHQGTEFISFDFDGVSVSI